MFRTETSTPGGTAGEMMRPGEQWRMRRWSCWSCGRLAGGWAYNGSQVGGPLVRHWRASVERQPSWGISDDGVVQVVCGGRVVGGGFVGSGQM